MIYEKSCGAIVNRIYNGERQFLIIKHGHGGHWSFPKGHIESGESEAQTAVREILEETGINVVIDANFRKVINYSPRFNYSKDVIIFSATVIGEEEPTAQESEIEKVVWLNENDAFKKVNFKNYRTTLRECITYLNK